MSQNPTIPVSELSTEILVNTFLDGLSSYVADANEPLEDPLSSRSETEFLLTSFPTSGLELPHVIVSEFNADNSALDLKQDVDQYDYGVSVRVLARNNHELSKLKDQTRHFIQAERQGILRDAGFAEPDVSTNEVQWDEAADYEEIQHVVSGLVHSRIQ